MVISMQGKTTEWFHKMCIRDRAKEVLEAEFLAVSDCRIYGFDTAEEALEKLLTWQDGEHLLFCVGSLYLMGEIKTILGGIKR